MFSSSMLSALNLLSVSLESAQVHERPCATARFIAAAAAAAAAAATLITTAKLFHAHSFCTCQTSYKIQERSGQLSVSEM